MSTDKPFGLWQSLQGVAITMWFGCAVVAATFGAFSVFYDPRGSGIGFTREVSHQLIIGYGPVVIATFMGFVKVLFNTFVMIDQVDDGGAVAKQREFPYVYIRRGVIFFYAMNLAGVIAVLGILFLMAFHFVPAEDVKTWAGVGASIWSATTALVFGRFFTQYSDEKKTALKETRGASVGQISLRDHTPHQTATVVNSPDSGPAGT